MKKCLMLLYGDFTSPSVLPRSVNSYPDLSKESSANLDALCPINSHGWRSSDLSLLFNDNVSAMHKEALLANMQKLGKNPDLNMSDEEMIENTPSRYCQNPVELQNFADTHYEALQTDINQQSEASQNTDTVEN